MPKKYRQYSLTGQIKQNAHTIVPKGHFQAEIGFLSEKTNNQTKSYQYPSALWKYGINENLELRLITELETVKTDGSKNLNGLRPVKVGFKARLWEEKGILPKTSFIGHFAVPSLASSNMKATYYAPSFRFTMQNTLAKGINLGYNLGAEWDGETPQPTFIYTLTTGFSLTNKLGCYIELFGFAPQKDMAQHSFDGGFTYLLQQNIMLDISAGHRITNNAPERYLALGFSFRLKD